MENNTPRFWELFFEVFEGLPRQGPGSKTCAAEALALCRELPDSPVILDLGCGVGAQTLYLAELTSGVITAIDNHAPSIDRLRSTIAERGLSHRIAAFAGDMATPGQPTASFDLVWSEGALYSIGLRNALRDCGFEPVGHFPLPDEAWWDDFYTPMEERIAELRKKYADDPEASAVLDQIAEEPEMHRRHSSYYAYEFFVASRRES